MSKIILELNAQQVEQLVERLPVNEKVRLVQRLQEETWAQRLDEAVMSIRKSFKKSALTSKDITRICEQTRQRMYNARTNKSRH